MSRPDDPHELTARAPESIDTDLVRRLADILDDTGLTEIEVEHGELKIRVARKAAASTASPSAGPVWTPASPPVLGASPEAPSESTTRHDGDVVKSPMVGTVYLQPQPGAKAFVELGDRVTEGQTLLVVEAMKTMNPIPAPRAGVIKQILVQDAQPIEYGEPLVVID